MKILLIGSSLPGAIEHKYFSALNKHHSVCVYDIQKKFYNKYNRNIASKIFYRISPKLYLKNINIELLKYLSSGDLRYDLIIIFKGMQLFPEAVKVIKDYCHLLVNYNLDHPYLYFSRGSGNNYVKNSISTYDIYFSYSRNIVKGLKSLYGVDSYQIPFATDDQIELKTNISRLSYVNKNTIFIGAWDKERDKFLSELENSNILIFGDKFWGTRSSKVNQGRFQKEKLYDAEYYYASSAAIGSINILRKQNIIEQSHNMRTFEVPGCGGLLLSQRTEEQMEYFEDGKEAIFFDSIEELSDKIHFLNKNWSYVEKIKKAAITRVDRSSYGYEDRATEIMKIVQNYI